LQSPRKKFHSTYTARDQQSGAEAGGFVADPMARTTGFVSSRVWEMEEMEGQAWLQPLDQVSRHYLSEVGSSRPA
jgi:hypothetical protein